MTAREWVEERRRCEDDRAVIASILGALADRPHRGEAATRRLEALAKCRPAAGVLDVLEDAETIRRICALVQRARKRLYVSLDLLRLWQPPSEVGVAWFPVARGDQARVLALRVGQGLTPPTTVDAQFQGAIEAAQRWVGRHLHGSAALVRSAGWQVDGQPLPLQGASVFTAAVVAFASLATATPAPTNAAYTGCPPEAGARVPAAVQPATQTAKLAACGRHAAVQTLFVADIDAWPAVDGGVKLAATDRLDLLLVRRLGFTLDGLRGERTPVPADAGPGAVFTEHARAVLSRASAPLTGAALDQIVEASWGRSITATALRLGEVLAADDALLRLDDGRWCLVRDRADPGRLHKVQLGDLAPAGDALTPARRAWDALRGADDRAQVAEFLSTQQHLAPRRLALALRLVDAPAPLAALAESVVTDGDGPSLALALQAVGEVALYLLAGQARGAETKADAKVEARPSLGSLSHVALRHPRAEAAEVREALERVPKVLNAWLHHFGGWASVATLPDDAWAPGGEGAELLVHVERLVVACEGIQGPKRWGREGALGAGTFEFYRGYPDHKERWWRFDRGITAPSREPRANAPLDRLPSPVARAAADALAALGARDWLAALAALDRVVAVWLRLAAAAAPPSVWLAASLNVTRPTKRRLLALASQGPLDKHAEKFRDSLDALERMEHHPGPVADFGPWVEGVAQRVFGALAELARAELDWVIQIPEGAQRVLGPKAPLEVPAVAGRDGVSATPPGGVPIRLWAPIAAPTSDGGVRLLGGAHKAGKAKAGGRLLKGAWFIEVRGRVAGAQRVDAEAPIPLAEPG